MVKSLKNIIPNFTEAIYKTQSGEESLNRYIKPLLENARLFYRVSSFFTPSAIKKILSELSACLQKGGDIKLVIGIHETEKLIPILDKIEERDIHSKFIIAIEELISGELNDLLDVIESDDEFLFVFSELIYQNHIKIKIAAVRKDYEFYLQNNFWPENYSTFHAKTTILKDENDTVIIGGTINFSNKGYGENVEDVVLLGSWFSPKACLNAELEFQQIWLNEHKDSYSIEFGQSLRKIVSQVINKSEKIKRKVHSTMNNNFNYNNLLCLIQNSPLYYHNSFEKVKLLPHQNEVYRTLLSRWPIYGLVADEVGLGKTIEAGAVIKYLKKFCAVKKSALLVPSSLRYQWQREMYNLFGLKFYVYEPASKSLVFSPNNELEDTITNVRQGNFFNQGVENIIFSWHYLRMRGANGDFRLNENDHIDLIVVDESHGARVTESLSSDERSTQLHQFLTQLLPKVKHKLLLTATPYQTSLRDYQSLLELLMQNDNLGDGSFDRMIRINSGFDLTPQQKITGMLEIVERKTYKPIGVNNDLDTSYLPLLVNTYNDSLYTINHPTTILTIRNTRDILKEIGYHFPSIMISSKPINLDIKQNLIFTRVNEYIETHLFDFETILKGNSAGLGFVRSIYQQRIVSSFKACLDTLSSRLNKLRLILNNGFVEGELIEVEEEDEAEIENISLYERIELNDVHIAAAQTEINFICEILGGMQKILYSNQELKDPKIEKVIELVLHHLKNDDTIILFSRFTSTTNFLVERMKNINEFKFGRYQGNAKEIIIDKEVYSFSRQIIAEKFLNGEFPVIICSDAASEGLNLQKANVLINVDVPWNPARLLQRFGRIDRFGQSKDELFFYNLYYPNTIEDRIYTRLIDRNEEFRQILGMTPEITSSAHILDLTSREFRDPYEEAEYLYKNTLLNLKKEDNKRIHDNILEIISKSNDIIVSSLVENNFGVIQEGNIEIGGFILRFSTNELDRDYLNINHPFLKYLLINNSLNSIYKIHEITNKQNQLMMYCVIKDSIVYPLISIVNMLKYLILGEPFLFEEMTDSFSINEIEKGFVSLLCKNGNKLIYHNFINFNGHFSEMYKDLKIIKTELNIYAK